MWACMHWCYDFTYGFLCNSFSKHLKSFLFLICTFVCLLLLFYICFFFLSIRFYSVVGLIFVVSLLHNIYTSVVCRVAVSPYGFKRERKHEDDSLCGSLETSRRILATGSQAPNILFSRIIGAAKNVKEKIFLCYSTIWKLYSFFGVCQRAGAGVRFRAKAKRTTTVHIKVTVQITAMFNRERQRAT